IYETGSSIWRSKGQALEREKKEFIDSIKLLQGTSGEKFGFVDIAPLSVLHHGSMLMRAVGASSWHVNAPNLLHG
ncbi:hypothetical protein AMTR_s05597p00006080, partial [Amborella trichopoda]